MISPEIWLILLQNFLSIFIIFLLIHLQDRRGFKNAVVAASIIVVTTPDLTAISDADRVVGFENQGYTEDNISLIVNRIKPKLERK